MIKEQGRTASGHRYVAVLPEGGTIFRHMYEIKEKDGTLLLAYHSTYDKIIGLLVARLDNLLNYVMESEEFAKKDFKASLCKAFSRMDGELQPLLQKMNLDPSEEHLWRTCYNSVVVIINKDVVCVAGVNYVHVVLANANGEEMCLTSREHNYLAKVGKAKDLARRRNEEGIVWLWSYREEYENKSLLSSDDLFYYNQIHLAGKSPYEFLLIGNDTIWEFFHRANEVVQVAESWMYHLGGADGLFFMMTRSGGILSDPFAMYLQLNCGHAGVKRERATEYAYETTKNPPGIGNVRRAQPQTYSVARQALVEEAVLQAPLDTLDDSVSSCSSEGGGEMDPEIFKNLRSESDSESGPEPHASDDEFDW